ncbi:MAG TPA: glycosyltransferase family 4 protein [Rhodopila sp.]|nr:glycosyltransferase family 4 protein [Rhodopila sp.]
MPTPVGVVVQGVTEQQTGAQNGSRASYGNGWPPSSPPARKRRILFAKLGSFSHTNERVIEQLSARFPAHEIVVFDVKDHIRRQVGTAAWNACLELALFGPSVFQSASERHAFFFLTPFMFRRLSAAIQERFGPEADSFDFTLQTQGLFNASLPGRPFVVYTDYTLASNLNEEARDARLMKSPAFLALERAMYQRADKILVTAAHVKQTLVQYYGCDAGRITPIMIGANVTAAPSSAALDRYAHQRILFVGIDWERKGGPTLLAAFEKVAERFPNATLTIAGCAPPTTHPRVKALGLIPRADVAAQFASASVFCLPSLVEPSAVASVEAMAFRLPVVATNVGGFPEMIRDGETGLLVPPHDPDALAEALGILLAQPERAQAMGAAGYQRSKFFTWDAVGNRFHAETRMFLPKEATAALSA